MTSISIKLNFPCNKQRLAMEMGRFAFTRTYIDAKCPNGGRRKRGAHEVYVWPASAINCAMVKCKNAGPGETRCAIMPGGPARAARVFRRFLTFLRYRAPRKSDCWGYGKSNKLPLCIAETIMAACCIVKNSRKKHINQVNYNLNLYNTINLLY